MTGLEYVQARARLKAFEALEKNPAFAEVLERIREEHGNCIDGLRNRALTVAQRQEFQEGADLTDRLLVFHQQRIAGLRRQTQLSEDELKALDLSDDIDP